MTPVLSVKDLGVRFRTSSFRPTFKEIIRQVSFEGTLAKPSHYWGNLVRVKPPLVALS